jgi:hypothetical protein
MAFDRLLGRDGGAEMFAVVNRLHQRHGASAPGRLRRLFVGCAVVAGLTLAAQSDLQAADCPPPREPNLPKSGEPASNIAMHKEQLKAYHNVIPPGATVSAYAEDIKLVIGDALRYVTDRPATAEKLAVVLDIDETSLSNWKNLELNDFGFIKDGSCPLQVNRACGFDAWIELEQATKIGPTLEFYNAIRARNIAVFFITGRRNSQKSATIRNLKREGFKNWSGLMTRADKDHGTVAKFKSDRRAEVENGRGYKIIANIGDQESDLKDGEAPVHAECTFKLPNPFYFIK